MNKLLSYRHDSYSAVRGRPSILAIDCDACGGFVALYQKDGPGPLKRMYKDRIVAPVGLVSGIQNLKELACPHCKEVLGVSVIYQKEKRPAFRLFQSAISKQKITLKQASSRHYS